MANRGAVVISIDGDASGFERALKDVGNKGKRIISGIGTVSKGIAKGATLVYGAVSAAMSVAGAASVKYNANIEQLQTSFATMTGSAEKAADVVERLRTMGATTPFETADLAKITQLLMQYGFTADDALEKMRMLGDISQGNAQAMESIATGYAQMSSAGKVNLQDIKQMINGGYNPLQEISERTGESMESLYNRISKGTMAVDEITESMRYATSEGGKFFGSMESQSQTINGQISTVKDNLSSFGGDLFRPLTEAMRSTLMPEANAILGQLQSAYASRGIEGMMDVVNAQLPRLMTAGTSAAQKIFAGISKQLPGLMRSLLSNLPSILMTTVDLVPQIADTLFTVAASAVEILVGKLPELVPALSKGVLNLAKSVLGGVEKAIGSIFTGIEQMMHKGQVKIAGFWVDESEVAKYKFKLETDVTQPVSAIETAYKQIQDALNTDLLDDTQRGEIEDMIGDDYDAIYNKLLSFGLSKDEAAPLAQQIADASKVITAEIKKLNVGADAQTIEKWYQQADGSNTALIHYARMAGLSDEDVDEIVRLYDEANGRLRDGTPNFAQTIYEKLTDGLADDEETVKALKEGVNTWATDAVTALEEGYNAAIAELDPQAPDYAQRLAELNAQYEAAKTEIETIKADSMAIIGSLAGKSTQSVEEAYETIAGIETQVNALEQRIQALKGEALSAGESAFKVVRSGAQADEATISAAVNLKVTEFKLNEQEAEDAYQEAVDTLVDDLANRKITQAEYETQLSAAGTEKEAAIQAGQQAFDKAFTEIILGIAESQGSKEALMSALETFQQEMQIKDLMAQIFGNLGEIDSSAAEGLKAALSTVLGDAFSPDTFDANIQAAQEGNVNWLKDYFAALTQDVESITDTQIGDTLGGKIAALLSKAMEQGILTDTGFDASNTEALLTSLLSGMDLSTAGEDATKGFGEGMASADLTTEAARMEKNAEESIRTAFDSHSPARKMIPLGKDAAAGVGQGMAEAEFTADATKMASAAKTASEAALKGSGENAGKMFALGVARGIRSGRSAVVSAAIEIARASVRAIKAELQIASPSRVTTELGKYTGKGFELGMVESLNAAIRSAQSVVGSMNLTPRLSAPDLGSAFASAAGSLVDAESMRPIYLNVNGRQLATVTAADVRRAQNSYNRKIALGVGK